jgi:hypothetical protein
MADCTRPDARTGRCARGSTKASFSIESLCTNHQALHRPGLHPNDGSGYRVPSIGHDRSSGEEVSSLSAVPVGEAERRFLALCDKSYPVIRIDHDPPSEPHCAIHRATDRAARYANRRVALHAKSVHYAVCPSSCPSVCHSSGQSVCESSGRPWRWPACRSGTMGRGYYAGNRVNWHQLLR